MRRSLHEPDEGRFKARLASCGTAVDYIPTWAGGLPKDVPPRPGTPEYDAFRQKMDAEVTRD